jgi:hypothetical protein
MSSERDNVIQFPPKALFVQMTNEQFFNNIRKLTPKKLEDLHGAVLALIKVYKQVPGGDRLVSSLEDLASSIILRKVMLENGIVQIDDGCIKETENQHERKTDS